ncbi:hypothetical protein Rhopal_007798-T1 [Rhodotorula paludigena]|uniref:GH16 domain-containing protein n=1 Tax=Rhodotorula paludigena TaxID=86838 RepID=A0AAV5GZA9_9BASI|nr:hypothetical protein Rhopal_007798-T1 [Rhodotorula paludigena]
MLSLLAILATLPLLSLATIQPTFPGGRGITQRAGDVCVFKWNGDVTGTWKSFDLDLMSGSNYEMVQVARIASGLDGTAKAQDEIFYECPEVDPPAPIYFLQATQDGKDPVWTNRFTITAQNGSWVPAQHHEQPDDEAIPWGVGKLADPARTISSGTFDAGSNIASMGSAVSQTWATMTVGSSGFPAASASTAASNEGQWSQPASSSTPSWPGSQSTWSPSSSITGFQQGQACDAKNLCSMEAPCCSEYGYCGTGRCYQLQSWGSNRILLNSSQWNGDAETYDWLVEKSASAFSPNLTMKPYPHKFAVARPDIGPLTASSSTGETALALSLTEDSNGTTITSTRSVLYGEVTARIKSVAGAGVLTSFALLSGTRDEIDWDTFKWTPKGISWLVDGVALRNVTKDGAASAASGSLFGKPSSALPQTPARIQFSIWAPGRAGQPEGLVDFAGGATDWTSQSYQTAGYYASYVSSIKVNCYDPSLLNGTLPTSTASAFGSSGTLYASSWPAEPLSSVASVASSAAMAIPSVLDNTLPQGFQRRPQPDLATSTATEPQAWWTGRARNRKRIVLEKVKRQQSFSSYSYGELNDDGEVAVSFSNDATTIGSDAATGLDMAGSQASQQTSSTSVKPDPSAPVKSPKPDPFDMESILSASILPSQSTHSDHSASGSNSASPAEMTGKTTAENWEELGTPAHVGILRKAASTHGGGPKPDAGGAYAPIGRIYSGTGEIRPGQDLYTGGQVPVVPVVAPLQRSSSSSSKKSGVSRSSTLVSKYAADPAMAQTGYVPSSQLKQQYGLQG